MILQRDSILQSFVASFHMPHQPLVDWWVRWTSLDWLCQQIKWNVSNLESKEVKMYLFTTARQVDVVSLPVKCYWNIKDSI